MSDNFNDYSEYYNLLYKDKNYKAEVEYLTKLLENKKSKVLDLGCGTGIHASLLKKKGYFIEGVEISKKMALQAIKNNVKCTISDISNYKLKNKFDYIISMFHVISYVTDNEKLIKTFKNAYIHLNKGGKFIFDVWYTPAVYSIGAETKIKIMEDSNYKITRISEPLINYKNNTIDVKFKMFCEKKNIKNSFFVIEEIHKMRHFSNSEIDLIAKMCNFRILKIEEPFTKESPSEKTWGVLYVLEKI